MPELPTTFGKYFLTEKLATGGMAEIYLAKIVGPGGFEKQLVIKQIHPKLSGQRHFVDLFVAEAKTLVTLAHGNIVPVYELGVVGDTYFIAMDYIDGPTLYRLTEMLARKDAVMAPDVAAFITARIVEGLDYAHRKGEGVIHRDLSPRNVMLSRDGEVKLVDFGIAVTLGNAGEDETAQSAPTGSFPYMSPEQVRKEQLTGQTDLFSVGVLAWEMLVGHRLFARDDPDATLYAVTEGEIPRPTAERPEIPAKLEEIVMRALERDKTARWANAGEMLAALQRYLYGLEEPPGPREVAALVAKYCPPEMRRMPTHAEGPFEAELAEDAAATGATEATPPPSPAAGPHTAVIPRDAAARGKPIRHKSFATHVDMKDMLDRATPLFGVEAIDDAGPQTKVSPPKPATNGATAAVATDDDDTGRRERTDDAAVSARRARSEREDDTGTAIRREPRVPDDGPDSTLRIRTGEGLTDGAPPSQRSLILIALGGLGVAAVAVFMFYKMRGQVADQPDAMPKLDAPFYLLPDAAPPDTPADAAPADVPDDTPEPPKDAAERPRDASPAATRPEAGVLAPPVDARPAPTGTATVELGADPWGDIRVDGQPKGRTPMTLTLSSGKHTIEVIFAGEDPPRTKTFTVDLAPGATDKKFADFTKP